MLNKKLLMFGLVFLIMISFVYAGVLDIDDNLVAYWKGDGTLLDEQENYHLSAIAGTEYSDGAFGQGLRIDDDQFYYNGAFASAPIDTVFAFDFFTNMTTCAIYSTSSFLIGWWGDSANWGWIRCFESDGKADLYMRIGGSVLTRINGVGPVLSGGALHHIGVNQNATTISLWIDGVIVGTDTANNMAGTHTYIDFAQYRNSDGEGRSVVDDIAYWSVPKESDYFLARYNDGNFAELTEGEPEDSCSPDSPLSADHTFDCSDNCLQSTPLDAGGNDLYFIGTDQTTDTFTLTSFFTNFKDMLVIHCYITGIGASFFT